MKINRLYLSGEIHFESSKKHLCVVQFSGVVKVSDIITCAFPPDYMNDDDIWVDGDVWAEDIIMIKA